MSKGMMIVLIAFALVGLAVLAFNSGYDVGSDIAERENAEEAG